MINHQLTADLPPFAQLALARRPELRPTERRVVEHLLSLDPTSPAATASAVANALSVSQATVVNAVQRLGYAGFGDFRRRLIAERAVEAASVPAEESRQAADEDPVLAACRRVFAQDLAAIELTQQLLDRHAFRRVAERLAAAPYVLCIGAGWSGVLARMAAGTFTKYGIRATGEELGIEQLSLVEVADARTVVFAISHRGRADQLIEIVDRARARGMVVIALTHRPASELAKRADEVLDCTGASLPEQAHPNQTSGPTTYLTVVRALAEAVFCISSQRSATAGKGP